MHKLRLRMELNQSLLMTERWWVGKWWRNILHVFARSMKSKMTPAARSKIVRQYDIVDYCNLEQSPVAMTMSYHDRYMSEPSGSKTRRIDTSFQLTCLAFLFLAPMTIDTTHKVSRGCYDRQEILDAKQNVLGALGYFTPSQKTVYNHVIKTIGLTISS